MSYSCALSQSTISLLERPRSFASSYTRFFAIVPFVLPCSGAPRGGLRGACLFSLPSLSPSREPAEQPFELRLGDSPFQSSRDPAPFDSLSRAFRIAADVAAAPRSRPGEQLRSPDRQPQELSLGPDHVAPDAAPLRLVGTNAAGPPPADHLF